MFSRYSSSSDQLVSSFLRNYYLCRFLYFSVEIGRNKKIFSTFFLKLEDERERKNGARERQSRRKNKRGQHRDELRKIFLERWHANIYLLFSLSTKLQLLCYYSISREHILYVTYSVLNREVSQ